MGRHQPLLPDVDHLSGSGHLDSEGRPIGSAAATVNWAQWTRDQMDRGIDSRTLAWSLNGDRKGGIPPWLSTTSAATLLPVRTDKRLSLTVDQLSGPVTFTDLAQNV